MRQFWIAVVLFLLAMPLPSLLNAMMVKIPLEQLAKDAELIVMARVESVDSQKQEDILFSLAEFKVEKVLKGKAPSGERVTVEFEGGRLRGEAFLVEDSPNYRPGEEVVAFLKKIPNGNRYTTVGMLQGKYLIKKGIVLEENLPLEAFLKKIENILRKERN